MVARPQPILSAALAAVLALATPLAPRPAAAQDAAIRLGGSLQLSGQQLEVTADQLEVDQQSGASVFTGEVLAVQGDLRLTAGTVRIEYSQQPGGGQRVERLVASGGVTLVTPEEALEAREAIYVIPRGTLEMTGDVLFVQGQNILSGQRFTADLNAGTGQMSGRVRTVIRME
jgi:lipopolysaccharide export system protein LptA